MDKEFPPRYVAIKASGSRYAYVNDTHERRTVKRFDIFKGDGWTLAENLAKRLNDQDVIDTDKSVEAVEVNDEAV